MAFLLKYWKLGVLALIVAASVWVTREATAGHYKSKIADIQLSLSEAQARAQEANTQKEALQAALAETVGKLHAEREKKARVVEVEVVKEVIKYVQNPDAGKCRIPTEFVRVHDTAASSGGVSEDTEAAPGAESPARRVTDIDVLEVVTDNYGRCNRWRRQLQSWIEWSDGIEELEDASNSSR